MEKISGMSNERKCSVEVVVINEDKVSNEGMSLEMLNDEIIAMDSIQVVSEEVISKDSMEQVRLRKVLMITHTA